MNILKEDHLSSLPGDLIAKAKSMSKAYEYIYCVENLIRLYLIDKLGNEIVLSRKVRNNIESKKNDEQNHEWIPLRGNSDLYYTDFSDLIGIIDENWECLKCDFPDQIWIKSKLGDLRRFRNMIAHNSFLEHSEMDLVRGYFNAIIKQLKIKSSPKKATSILATEGFIFGLKDSKIFTYNELCSGITYELNYPLEVDVIPITLTTSFEQIGPLFCVNYANSGVYLYPEFTSNDISSIEDLYEYSENILFEIGQYDIDADGIDELFICFRVYDTSFNLDNTIMINVFKYYPPAFHNHASRQENWENWGPFSTGTIIDEPKASVNDNSIIISRNFRSYFDQWTFLNGEFIHRGI